MKACTIEIEEIDQSDLLGVRGVVRTPSGSAICATRVFSSVFPASANDRQRARDRAVDMAAGLGYAEDL